MEEQLSYPLSGLYTQRFLVDDVAPSDYFVQHPSDRHFLLRGTVVAMRHQIQLTPTGCKRHLPTLLVFARSHGRNLGVNRYLPFERSFGRRLDHLCLNLGEHSSESQGSVRTYTVKKSVPRLAQ